MNPALFKGRSRVTLAAHPRRIPAREAKTKQECYSMWHCHNQTKTKDARQKHVWNGPFLLVKQSIWHTHTHSQVAGKRRLCLPRQLKESVCCTCITKVQAGLPLLCARKISLALASKIFHGEPTKRLCRFVESFLDRLHPFVYVSIWEFITWTGWTRWWSLKNGPTEGGSLWRWWRPNWIPTHGFVC